VRNTALLVLGLLLLAGAIWLGFGKARRAGGALPGSADTESAAPPASELLPVSLAASEAGAPDSSRSSSPASTGTSDAPLRALIRGRVVMADTLEPLEGVLSVRLRTADLGLVDPVETQPDGSFVSKRAFPEGGVLARVCTAEDRELVDHEGRFDPSSTEPWVVLVPGSEFPTSARGRVVDLAGDPVSVSVVYSVPYAPMQPGAGAGAGQPPPPEEPWPGEPDEHGEFTILGLTPGAWELWAVGRYVRGPAQVFALSRGENDLGILVLPSPGALCGRLVADVEPRAHFLVHELGTERELSLQEDPSEDGLADGVHPFRISGLPAGEYELSLLPLDDQNYEPASLRVRPPASGLEFRAVSPPSSVELSVQDAASGESLHYEAFSRVRGRWLDGFHPQAERWLIVAEEHRPASVDPAALPSTDESPKRVTVLLERGWGQLRLYQTGELDPGLDTYDKWSRPPLPGVQVRADGFSVATSDQDGVALVSLARAPASIDEWLGGWSKSSSSSYKWRGMVVVTMTRE
jgi:hypothetical protein